jgi:hypothetical protein
MADSLKHPQLIALGLNIKSAWPGLYTDTQFQFFLTFSVTAPNPTECQLCDLTQPPASRPPSCQLVPIWLLEYCLLQCLSFISVSHM